MATIRPCILDATHSLGASAPPVGVRILSIWKHLTKTKLQADRNDKIQREVNGIRPAYHQQSNVMFYRLKFLRAGRWYGLGNCPDSNTGHDNRNHTKRNGTIHMRNVLIPTKLNATAGDILRDSGFTVVQDTDTPLADLIKANPDTSALIVRSEAVTADVIDSLPNLKVIIRAGAGYNTIDTKHARRKGIDVMNTPGANANAVAEEVIALILACYRFVVAGDTTTRQGLWNKKDYLGRELTGKTVAIVGLGNIGQLLVKRLTGFECRIIGYDPVISASKASDLGVELMPLEKLFETADIVSLHIPEVKETKGLINKSYFDRMKPGAMLVNCARAGIINEGDLRTARTKKELLYCNDVYPNDAPGKKSVADIADVMLPHVGANTREANLTAARRAAEQLIAYVNRGIMTYVVNKSVPEGLDEEHQALAFYLSKVARCYLGCDVQPDRIEISLYGGLGDYANWLIAPVVSGISSDFDPMFDFQDASEYLAEKGIKLVNRPSDESKYSGRSMTVDLFEGSGNTITKVSVRGTVAEGNPMVSRIDDFDKLYFEPSGKSVLVVYKDQPGMLAKITTVVAKYGINIIDIRCPYDPGSGNSIAVLKVSDTVDRNVLDEIKVSSGADKAVFLDIE